MTASIKLPGLLFILMAFVAGCDQPDVQAEADFDATGTENPIFRDAFTADPAPLVVGDTLFVYVGHDEATGDQMFNITEWLAYSTTDMKAWTAHGSIMKPTDFEWATGDAWASQVIEHEGTFYFYTTVQHGPPHVGKAIGVAVSDSPTGPFVDARGSALVVDETTPGPHGWDDIDPTVFVDDDGSAYIAWGNPLLYFAKLKPNMIELDGPIETIDLPNYTEGPWFHKREDTYYLTYPCFAHQGLWEKLCYAMAPAITGPWEYQGILMEQNLNSYTIHPGVIEFKDQWYLFYHTADLTLDGEEGGLGRRSVAVEYLEYNDDGTIQPITKTRRGVSVPLAELKAESPYPGVGSLATGERARNPIIWADVPDPSVIRVGDTYYMSSTTMHMSPGLPIMKSTDLVNWELVSYAYDTLVDNDQMTLQDGQDAYGKGSWASSLRHHDGRFYVSTFSATSGRTHIYSTDDVESGDWDEVSFEPSLHDNTLFFDDDGRVYMIYGGGDLQLVELEEDLSGIKPDGFNDVVIPDAHAAAGPDIMLPAEGAQLFKVDGTYYLLTITWPRDGMRTVVAHRADAITGPYESRVVLQDEGVAQGSLVDTPDGRWYAFLFGDRGSVGRIPYLIPVEWEDGWPMMGENGRVPATLDIPAGSQGLSGTSGIVTSDDFERAPGEPILPPAWQWNHNPDDANWEILQNPGRLRITTGRVDNEVVEARNTLTQRTFGPTSSAQTAIDISGMKDGDYAGLILLMNKYGFIGVRMEDGEKYFVQVSGETGSPTEVRGPLVAGDSVHLRIDADFLRQNDKAYFYFSGDGIGWARLGDTLQMQYTLDHFMGARFGLFTFATKDAGGYVDFLHYTPSDLIIATE